MQSTPLISRSGHLVGMISTHWRRPHQPTEHDLGRMDVLARQAADLIERSQSRESLRRGEERYHRLFEDDLTGNFLCTPEGRILLCNPAFAAIFGFSAAPEAVGTNIVDLYLDPGERRPLLERLKNEGKIERLEVWRKRRDGRPIHIIENLVGHFNAQGHLHEIQGYVFEDTQRTRTEEALRENRERLARAQEIAHLGSWELDLIGNQLTWSDEVYRIFGLPPQEFAATYDAFLDRVHPEDRAAVDAAYAGSLRDGRDTYEIEHRIVRKSTGEIRIVHEKCQHVRDASGRIIRSLGMVHDITERKRAQEALRMSEERFRTLHALSPIGIVLNRLDNGQFLESNQALWDMTGYTEEEFRALTYWDITPLEYQDMEAQQLELLHTAGRYGPYEKEYIRKDGSRFPVLLSGVRIRDPGGTELIYSVVQDITELKATEQALREWNAVLEDKVAERTAELQFRARQLQKLALELTQAEERERRRIAVILHEDLQQQIAGARFHLGLVRNRAGEDRQRRAVDLVDELLRQAIEKSRTLSRDLSPAVLHLNDLAELLKWLAYRVQAQQGLSVNVSLSGDTTLHSEAVAMFLFRAAQEMLFNVVKHAGVREAAIQVRRRRGYVSLAVLDQGRGFDPPRLKETSGVGLFSLRERAESLGGRMQVKSAKGKGSRFRITVPDGSQAVGVGPHACPLPTQAQSPASAVSVGTGGREHEDGPGGPPLRVLLVDDHDLVRAGLAALLRDVPGIELVGEAPDGREAIDVALNLQPDVVLMDVSMPLMSGDQATRQIKAYLPETRVVALSMYDEAEKKEEMFEAGAGGYILKTVSADELIAAIRGQPVDAPE